MTVNVTPVDVGAVPGDQTGDPARTAFQAVNANEAALKAAIEELQGRHFTVQNASVILALGSRYMCNNHAGITLTLPATFAVSATAFSDIQIANTDDASDLTMTPASGDAFFVDGATNGVDTTYAITPGNLVILSPRTTDSEWDLLVVGGGGGGGWDVEDTVNGNYGHGLNALDSLTVGSGLDNIAIGENAGTAITTGDWNIAIGTNALKSISTEVSNVAIGHKAGEAYSGEESVFIGTFAGQLQVTGPRCVALGYYALQAGTDNDDCIAIGFEALKGNSTGDDNVAIGSGALSATGSPANSTAIGYNALFLSTGIDNIALGTRCADSLTTGSYCLAVGRVDLDSQTDDYQIKIGSWSSVPILNGYMGTNTDVDMSGKVLTLTGPSALPAATVNQDGGNLTLRAGEKATGGGVNGLIIMDQLPTSDPTIVGALWANENIINVSAG